MHSDNTHQHRSGRLGLRRTPSPPPEPAPASSTLGAEVAELRVQITALNAHLHELQTAYAAWVQGFPLGRLPQTALQTPDERDAAFTRLLAIDAAITELPPSPDLRDVPFPPGRHPTRAQLEAWSAALDARDPCRQQRERLDWERFELEQLIDESWETLGPYPRFDERLDALNACVKGTHSKPEHRTRGRPKPLSELRAMIREGLVVWFQSSHQSIARPKQAELCALMPGGHRADTVSGWCGEYKRRGMSGGWDAEVELQWEAARRKAHVQDAVRARRR